MKSDSAVAGSAGVSDGVASHWELPAGRSAWLNQGGGMRLEVTVNPAGEHSRFHRRAPRLRKRAHPVVQVQACGGNRSLGVNPALPSFTQ
jgi:hypothetical protein